jgi:hypothetical protein
LGIIENQALNAISNNWGKIFVRIYRFVAGFVAHAYLCVQHPTIDGEGKCGQPG